MATLSTVSKYGFSSSSTSSVLTLMASIAALSESVNRKCTLKYILQTVFPLWLLLLTLGRIRQWTTGPHLVYVCEVVMTSLVLSTACVLDYHDSLVYASDLKSHTTPCLALYQYIFVQYCPFLCPPPVFLPLLSGVYIHVCLRNKLLPPSLITHLFSFSQSLSLHRLLCFRPTLMHSKSSV